VGRLRNLSEQKHVAICVQPSANAAAPDVCLHPNPHLQTAIPYPSTQFPNPISLSARIPPPALRGGRELKKVQLASRLQPRVPQRRESDAAPRNTTTFHQSFLSRRKRAHTPLGRRVMQHRPYRTLCNRHLSSMDQRSQVRLCNIEVCKCWRARVLAFMRTGNDYCKNTGVQVTRWLGLSRRAET
jgi:hypothetical protein